MAVVVAVAAVVVVGNVLSRRSEEVVEPSRPETVEFRTRDGRPAQVEAFPGLLSLVARPSTGLGTVQLAVREEGGEVADAMSAAGLYLVRLAPGQEADVLDALYRHSWLISGVPAYPVSGAVATKVIDVPFDARYLDPKFYEDHPEELRLAGDPCGLFHGDLTASQVTSAGPTTIIDPRPPGRTASEMSGFDVHKRLAQSTDAGDVINISMAPTGDFLAELAWVVELFAAVDAGADAVVVLAAGNGEKDPTGRETGVDISLGLAVASAWYPKAAERILVVEAMGPDRQRAGFSNYASSGTVIAPGVQVPLDAEVSIPDASGRVSKRRLRMRCNGTSFAAPIVADVLADLWRRNPGATAAQVRTAFLRATTGWSRRGCPPAPPACVPWDRNDRSFRAALDRESNRLRGGPPSPTSPAPSRPGPEPTPVGPTPTPPLPRPTVPTPVVPTHVLTEQHTDACVDGGDPFTLCPDGHLTPFPTAPPTDVCAEVHEGDLPCREVNPFPTASPT